MRAFLITFSLLSQVIFSNTFGCYKDTDSFTNLRKWLKKNKATNPFKNQQADQGSNVNVYRFKNEEGSLIYVLAQHLSTPDDVAEFKWKYRFLSHYFSNNNIFISFSCYHTNSLAFLSANLSEFYPWANVLSQVEKEQHYVVYGRLIKMFNHYTDGEFLWRETAKNDISIKYYKCIGVFSHFESNELLLHKSLHIPLLLNFHNLYRENKTVLIEKSPNNPPQVRRKFSTTDKKSLFLTVKRSWNSWWLLSLLLEIEVKYGHPEDASFKIIARLYFDFQVQDLHLPQIDVALQSIGINVKQLEN